MAVRSDDRGDRTRSSAGRVRSRRTMRPTARSGLRRPVDAALEADAIRAVIEWIDRKPACAWAERSSLPEGDGAVAQQEANYIWPRGVRQTLSSVLDRLAIRRRADLSRLGPPQGQRRRDALCMLAAHRSRSPRRHCHEQRDDRREQRYQPRLRDGAKIGLKSGVMSRSAGVRAREWVQISVRTRRPGARRRSVATPGRPRKALA